MMGPLPVPCLHRVHLGEPQGSFRIHQFLRVSIELTLLEGRLEDLEMRANLHGLPRRSVFVTFDDGWMDPVVLVPRFQRWEHLQPVLFLTSKQMRGDRRLLPLSRLYDWCAKEGVSLEEMKHRGVTRAALKALPEEAQHAWLDRLGVADSLAPQEVLSIDAARSLMDRGWLVGSHGHDHHDLRRDDPSELYHGLETALAVVDSFGGRPWLAWPEGRCTPALCESAKQVGFTRQFSLMGESGSVRRKDLVHRSIWS